jgi:hypothetical protein
MLHSPDTVLAQISGEYIFQMLLTRKEESLCYSRILMNKYEDDDDYEKLQFLIQIACLEIPIIIFKVLHLEFIFRNGKIFTSFCIQFSELNDA